LILHGSGHRRILVKRSKLVAKGLQEPFRDKEYLEVELAPILMEG
jgi:hypothetical protein